MTKDVVIKITGLHFDKENPDSEPVELLVAGQYYNRNGKHHVVYEEASEGSKEPEKNHVKFTSDYLELTKKGTATTNMLFEKGKKNMTYYYTPYGALLIGVDANKVEVKESDTLIEADVMYGMELNNEHVADCQLHMEVRPRGSRISL